MDMVTMGLMGVVVGASSMGAAGVARSAADTFLPRMGQDNNHRHQIKMQLHAQRCDTVQRWRTGLADARNAYRQWASGRVARMRPTWSVTYGSRPCVRTCRPPA